MSTALKIIPEHCKFGTIKATSFKFDAWLYIFLCSRQKSIKTELLSLQQHMVRNRKIPWVFFTLLYCDLGRHRLLDVFDHSLQFGWCLDCYLLTIIMQGVDGWDLGLSQLCVAGCVTQKWLWLLFHWDKTKGTTKWW